MSTTHAQEVQLTSSGFHRMTDSGTVKGGGGLGKYKLSISSNI